MRENHRNDNKGESPDFHEFTLYMHFDYFLEMAIPMMAFNVKNFEKKVNLWKSGMDPSYNFHDFSHKNDNLGLKMKVLKFLGIHPRIK